MTNDPTRLMADLAAALGAGFVTADPADLEPHLVEGRKIYRGTALALVSPGSTAEVAAVVRIAAAHGVPVVAHGGNTGLVGGGTPDKAIVLSLRRLNRIRDLDPANMTMTVEAGAVLQSVQEAAAAAGCLFPLSLGSEGSCTIGGNLSTNAGGTAVLRYGNARELALGLEVVLADGSIVNDLNRLRKNNTGYDLRNLFIGAEGTLGIITAAVLKLFPAQKARATAWVGLTSQASGLALFRRFRQQAGDCLVGFEFMYDSIIQIVCRHSATAVRPLQGNYPFHALIELTAADPAADLRGRMETLLGEALDAGEIEDATIAASEQQANALWTMRETMSGVQSLEGGSIKHDISVPVSRVAEFLVAATAACERELEGIRVVAFGHFGDGNIHFNLSQPVGMDKAAYLARWSHFNRIVHDIAVAMGGSISAEHGIGLIKREELARYKDPAALALMRRLKAALDPGNILNPGKILMPENK